MLDGQPRPNNSANTMCTFLFLASQNCTIDVVLVLHFFIEELTVVHMQALWEDNKTGLRWATVNQCYFPRDLPEVVGRPCTPEYNEVCLRALDIDIDKDVYSIQVYECLHRTAYHIIYEDCIIILLLYYVLLYYIIELSLD